jgi:hypothetical protein
VWQSVNVELVINRSSAKGLDLAIPPSLVGFAKRIVD